MSKEKTNKTERGLKTILLLGIILLIVLIIIIVLITIQKKDIKYLSEDNALDYFYSDDFNYSETSPDRIGEVYHAYKGSIDPKTISKTTYYFTNVFVPDCYEKLSNGSYDIEGYYSKYYSKILTFIGISSYEKFEGVANAIKNLKPQEQNLVYESSYFDIDSLKTDSRKVLTVDLIIKYTGCEELKVTMTMQAKEKYDRSAIDFSI